MANKVHKNSITICCYPYTTFPDKRRSSWQTDLLANDPIGRVNAGEEKLTKFIGHL